LQHSCAHVACLPVCLAWYTQACVCVGSKARADSGSDLAGESKGCSVFTSACLEAEEASCTAWSHLPARTKQRRRRAVSCKLVLQSATAHHKSIELGRVQQSHSDGLQHQARNLRKTQIHILLLVVQVSIWGWVLALCCMQETLTVAGTVSTLHRFRTHLVCLCWCLDSSNRKSL
jgi:hypothetical protein